MKKLTILMGILLAGTYALAGDTSTSKGPPAKGTLAADVVASDETAKTITVRPVASDSSSSGESFTLPVEGKAVASLKSIKNGERVNITCRSGGSSSSNEPEGSAAGSSGIGASSGAESAGSLIGGDRIESPSGKSSALSVSNCALVTEISKVKASAPASGH
jgi:hypothetical protein